MGADMLVAAMPAPRRIDPLTPLPTIMWDSEIIATVAKTRIDALDIDDELVNDMASLLNEDFTTVKELRHHALDAVHTITANGREITVIELPDFTRVPL